MKTEFCHKKICFLGDSIIQHGGFITCLRSYFFENDRKQSPLFFNRGLGGNRSVMAQALLADEVFALQPDYCFVHYGVNDMGIWLYDSQKEETKELIRERERRDGMFLKGIADVVKALKDGGIKPVLMSPCALNEEIAERTDIQTVGDNKEKAELIDHSFYKKKTFKKLNLALHTYNEKLKVYAQEKNIGFVDSFSQSLSFLEKSEKVYGADGIHLTDYGQEEFAKIILRYLSCEHIPETFEKNEWAERIAEIEKTERKIQYVKWAIFHPCLGYDTAQTEQNARQLLQKQNLSTHQTDAIQTYLRYKGSSAELRAELWQQMQRGLNEQ